MKSPAASVVADHVKTLRLSKNLSLPADEAVTQKYGFIGRSGSGKSYAAMKLTERTALEGNARFFETECTFDEADADGRTIEEIADDEIDAAMDSQ